MGNTIATTNKPTVSPVKTKKSGNNKATRTAGGSCGRNRNVELVRSKWCEAMNRQDVATIRKFASPDSICMYKGATAGMKLPEFLEAVIMIFDSFPDNKMVWDSIEEVQPGEVVVKNFQGRGTHTGKPFGFGPFRALPAKGVVVAEDPCHLTITVVKGKMVKFVIDTYCGDLVGPPGYYQKIGGIMVDQ